MRTPDKLLTDSIGRHVGSRSASRKTVCQSESIAFLVRYLPLMDV